MEKKAFHFAFNHCNNLNFGAVLSVPAQSMLMGTQGLL
jgi:hypothetical protein